MNGTSVPVIVTMSAAAVAVLYAFACEVRQDRTARRVKQWIAHAYPEQFAGLPWFQRRILTPRMALRLWVNQGLFPDPALQERYAPIARLERRKVIAVVVGLGLIALLLAGTALWGWSLD